MLLIVAWLSSLLLAETASAIRTENYCLSSNKMNMAVIQCDFYQSVKIVYANYGRTDMTVCTDSVGPFNITTCNAYQLYYTDQVTEVCDGKQTCNYIFPPFGMGDPCMGFDKYLEVRFNCERCVLQTWGERCDQHCYCESGHCNVETGLCPGGCMPGFHGPECNVQCKHGWYGPDCDQACYCKSEQCDSVTGVCPELNCQAGWYGDQCNNSCPYGQHGERCAEYCEPTCHICDRFVGCTACVPGRSLPDCKTVCPPGTYGLGCHECGHCAMKEPCNVIHGICPRGCEFGFRGELCLTSCEKGWFGKDCKLPCGNCKGDEVCDQVSGKCPKGCELGYLGHACSQAVWISFVCMCIPFAWMMLWTIMWDTFMKCGKYTTAKQHRIKSSKFNNQVNELIERQRTLRLQASVMQV